MDSFVDTNVAIAYSFSLDPLNFKSNRVFKKYNTIYWSNTVENEYKKVFKNKLKLLKEYFKDLKSFLMNDDYTDISFKSLVSFINKKNYSDKDKKKIKSSLSVFWNKYLDNELPSKNDVLNAIDCCLFDLSSNIYKKREEWLSQIKLTFKRIKRYNSIYNDLLGKPNVHESDVIIVLDAHDYNLELEEKIDFITFDKDFYNAASQISEFSFNKILGKEDFVFSS